MKEEVLKSLILTKEKEIEACKYALKEMRNAAKDKNKVSNGRIRYSGICFEIFLYMSKDKEFKEKLNGRGIQTISLCPILQQYKPFQASLTGFWFNMTSYGYKKRVELLEKLLKEHDI